VGDQVTLYHQNKINTEYVMPSLPKTVEINNHIYKLAESEEIVQGSIRINGHRYVPAAGKRQVQLVKEWEKQVKNWRTGEPQTQKLKLYKTVDGNEYFVASYSPMVDETQVFPSNKDGTDVDFGAAIGLGVGGEDFEAVWDDTGFEVAR
jgi:hypothetical protein